MKEVKKGPLIKLLTLLLVMLSARYNYLSSVEQKQMNTIISYAKTFKTGKVIDDATLLAVDMKNGEEVKVEVELELERQRLEAEENERKAYQARVMSFIESDFVGTNTNFELAEQIVNYALTFVGNPYVYGGNSLTEGTDCSGFTLGVFSEFGYSLPRTASHQAYVGNYVSRENVQIGDLVLYGYDGYVTHVALYIGDGQVVHALNSDVGIVVTRVDIMPILTIRRVL